MSESTLEAVAKAVHDLSESVLKMQAGQVDRETVERIAREVVDSQRAAAETANRRTGIGAEDLEPEMPALRRLSPRQRLEIMHARPARRVAAMVRRPVDDVSAFQDRADELVLVATMLRADPRETRFYSEEYLPAMRAAMDSTTATEGDEWVPQGMSASMIERINLALQVANLFPMVPMPTQPYDLPAAAVSRVRGGKAVEQTADTGQTGFKKITPGTRKVTLTAAKFAAEILVSKELEEDSILPILPFIQSEIVDFVSADIEDCILNGDTTVSHQDSDTTASDDPRKNFMGLRKLTLAQASRKTDGSSASALTVAMLRTNRVKMGKYGVRIADLAHIMSINSYIQLLSDTNVMTVDKYGPQATILAGELGKVDGTPIIVSEYMRTDLNASGVYDGTTTTETTALTVNRRGFIRGERRGMTLQWLRELYAEYDQDALVASVRQAFEQVYPIATQGTAAITYNVDS